MSILSVYQDSAPEQPLKVLTHIEDISATLAEVGVDLERYEASAQIAAGASPEEVIAAYRPQIDRLMNERGCVAVDVVSLNRDHQCTDEMRERFIEEHHHAAAEVRFLVAGRGLFTLHIGDLVYALLCEKHDLLSLPAGTRQWFDIGEQPHVVAIRLFDDPEGKVAQLTGGDIARRFPRLEDF